jgi:hypothetical protein
MTFYYFKRAAVVQIPKTPPKYKKEAILERKKLYEKNEGEVSFKRLEQHKYHYV